MRLNGCRSSIDAGFAREVCLTIEIPERKGDVFGAPRPMHAFTATGGESDTCPVGYASFVRDRMIDPFGKHPHHSFGRQC